MPQLKDLAARTALIGLAAVLVVTLMPTAALCGPDSSAAPTVDPPSATEEGNPSGEPTDPEEPNEGDEPVLSLTELDVLPVASLPFRMDAQEQERHAADAVKDALTSSESGISAEDLEGIEGELFTDFRLDEYPTGFSSVEEGGFDAPFELTLHPDLAERYVLKEEAKLIHVDAIEELKQPKRLRFNGTDGSQWLAQDVTATFAGHALSTTLDETAFTEELPLNSAEGIYENVTLYARNAQTHIVSKLVGLTYKLDKTAPVLTTFATDGEYREEGDTWFFANAARVMVSVKDPDDQVRSPGNPESPQGAPAPVVSGLASDDAWIEYEDQNGNRQVRGDLSISGLSGESGLLQMTLDGDQAVPVNSFKVHVKDRAGNVLQSDVAGVKEIPAHILRMVSDAKAPQLSVTFDNHDVRNGSFYHEARTGTFTVTEANFPFIQEYDPDQIIVSIQEDDRTHVFRAKDFQGVGNQAWQVVYEFAQDAAYAVEAQVVDLTGKASDRYATQFTVDTTAPQIDVAFLGGEPVNGIYYPAARTAVITVHEHNFAPELVKVDARSEAGGATSLTEAAVGAWHDEGDVHGCEISFPGQGVYDLAVSGTDLALNAMASYQCPTFVVDTEKPQIAMSVNGQEGSDFSAYRGECAVDVTVTDVNADPATSVTIMPVGLGRAANPYVAQTSITETQMDYRFPSPTRVPENDDVYCLVVRAVDRAGNIQERAATWSVNRFGSTYLLSDDTQAMIGQGYVRSENLCDLSIQEINPSGINESDVLVSLTQGMRSVTLVQGEDYTLQTQEDQGWQTCDYRISKDCFASDGLYQLSLRSTDAAGNASMNIMDEKAAEVAFTVDDTPPIISLVNAGEEGLGSDSHPVRFSVEDNGKVSHVAALAQGEPLSVQDDGNGWTLTPVEGVDLHAITIEARDAAGNVTTQQVPLGSASPQPLQPVPLIALSAVLALLIIIGRKRLHPT